MQKNNDFVQNVKLVARQELLPRFASVQRHTKHDGSFLTEADLQVQKGIQEIIRQYYPDDGFLAEEMSEAEQNQLLHADTAGVWILDPLDGTRNFAAGIPYYSVSLARLEHGQVVWGLVYDPERDECFVADSAGASLNDNKLCAEPAGVSLEQATALIDFKRLDSELASRLALQPPYSSQRSFGSVALDWCWLAAGRFHIYLHGRQNIWDYAAGHFIFSQAGGYSCTLQGEPLFVNQLKARSAVAALDQQLFNAWHAWLGIAQ